MNDVFDIKRFWALTLKFYRENMKFNLIFLGIATTYLFLCLCDFNPFVPKYIETLTEVQKADFVLHYQAKFTIIFWVFLIIYSANPACRSFKAYTSREKAQNALLLPASAFEKYLLGFLSSTVFFFIVYYIIFSVLVWIVSSYKYVGIEDMNFVDNWLGIQVPDLNSAQPIIRPVMPNVFHPVFDWGNKFCGDEALSQYFNLEGLKVLFWNLLLSGWLLWVSAFMWGSVTFRRKPALKVILIHTLLFIGVGYFLSKIGWEVIQYYMLQRNDSGLYVLPDLMNPYKLLVLYLFPLTYLFVTGLKLKNKQLN